MTATATPQPDEAELTRLRKEFPAKYSAPILEAIAAELRVRMLANPLVLDPFAGVGGIHALREMYACRTVGIELEPEYAACHPDTICGDSRNAAAHLQVRRSGPWRPDVLAFSPAYGNRFADQYLGSDSEKCRGCDGLGQITAASYPPALCQQCGGSGKAKSSRAGYAIPLGRKLTPGSGAALAWGQRYRETHSFILEHLATEVASAGTLWLVNVSSIFADKRYCGVMEWWVGQLAKHLEVQELVPVPTARMRRGQNHEARVPVEHLIVAVTR